MIESSPLLQVIYMKVTRSRAEFVSTEIEPVLEQVKIVLAKKQFKCKIRIERGLISEADYESMPEFEGWNL